MIDRSEFNGWSLIGCAVVVLIVLAITVHATVGWSEAGAAWAQAVGSVLALFVTGGLAIWEARQRRVDASAQRKETLQARIAVLELLRDQLGLYIQAQKQREDGGEPVLGIAHTLNFAIREALQVQLLEMPTPECVVAMANARAVIELLETRLGVLGMMPAHAEAIAHFEEGHDLLRQAVDELIKQAERQR